MDVQVVRGAGEDGLIAGMIVVAWLAVIDW